jgi:hypothetical protein
MEINGTLVQVLEAQTGIGKNGPWKKQGFVIETKEKFPKKVHISAWNAAADSIEKLQPGVALKVSFDVESREFNGKWYTDVKAWKVESGTNANTQANNASSIDDDFVPVKDDENEPLPF